MLSSEWNDTSNQLPPALIRNCVCMLLFLMLCMYVYMQHFHDISLFQQLPLIQTKRIFRSTATITQGLRSIYLYNVPQRPHGMEIKQFCAVKSCFYMYT